MLRTRLGTIVALSLLTALLAFGALVEWLFVREQRLELTELLQRDLARVQALVQSSELGATFLEGRGGGFELQFVSQDGEVVLPPDGGEPLPLATEPTLLRSGGPDGGERALLVAARPWLLPSGNEAGTIRLAMDVTDAYAARGTLLRSLVLGGLAIAALATVIGVALLGRALEPLGRLAEQADRIDPADPHLAAYEGPDDEVARVARALNHALAAIRARQRAERDALAEVAHELAAPLSVVAGQLEALAAEREDARYLAARDAADELLYTSQDLLALARGELEGPLELAAVDLHEVARRVAAPYGVPVHAEGPAEVLGSPERLGQVVRNLVRNAVQAAGAEGVRLHVRRAAGGVELVVEDDGPGLDPEEATRVFERYHRARPGPGVGVGLTVARRIVEQHEGTIAVSSSPGRGSTFTVRLPGLEEQLEPS